MTRIVVTEFVSLDGVMEEPRWTFDFDRGKEGDQFKYEELFDAESLLLGRVTYQGFAAAWPKMGGNPFAEKMNAMPKFVVSSMLKEASWKNSTIIGGDLESEVSELKDRFDGNLLVADWYGRDDESDMTGRIWRLKYVGPDRPARVAVDLTSDAGAIARIRSAPRAASGHRRKAV